MRDELHELEDAVLEFRSTADPDFIDPARLSGVIDGLQGVLSKVLDRARKRGDHLVAGQSACSWAAARCRMSKTSAADRLCVGQELENLPAVSQALSRGDVGYQSTAVICHLSEQLGAQKELIDEEQWISFAQKFSVKELRYLAHEARARWDPEGF